MFAILTNADCFLGGIQPLVEQADADDYLRTTCTQAYTLYPSEWGHRVGCQSGHQAAGYDYLLALYSWLTISDANSRIDAVGCCNFYPEPGPQ